MMSKWIFENMPVIKYPKNSCDSRAPLGPPAASRWFHARPTQQLSHVMAKERAPMTTSASGGRRYARIISVYIEPYPWALSLLSRRWSAAYELVLLYCCSTSWVSSLWCVSVGGSFGLWVGGRAGSWLCVVHVFCSFAFWTHGAFITHSTKEHCV